ncbi:glycolate oxidase [Podospora didyma]|uniref:D-lactate dehydrogenase (cytochrome) n=1 Tax=Podospora didyma TaxID=330526 RepID=A0AAE0NQF3_9PEZI|nr:glycolate oxidase [Podospora didyma]
MSRRLPSGLPRHSWLCPGRVNAAANPSASHPLSRQHPLRRFGSGSPQKSAERQQLLQNGGQRWPSLAVAGAIGLLGFGAGALFAQNRLGREPAGEGEAAIRRRNNHERERSIAYASPSQMLKAAEGIAKSLGPDAVTYEKDVLEHHGHSDWSTSNSPVRAVAVVYPRSTADVSCIARICSQHKVPMVPFGAGSSVEGNFSQPHSGICIDFSYMDKIIAFHPDDMDVVVQPGVNWVDLNSRIAHAGLFAPLDPSPTATIGGMVSTNCSGTNAMRYGTMKDWVLNLTVVLADGTIIKTRRRPRKTSAGYNLTSLFVGAEGTLGIVTEATLKLAPIPQDTSVAVVTFPTIRDAAAAASSLIRSGIQLAALELMDDVQMKVLNEHGSATVRKRKWLEQPTLFLKFSGTTEGIASDVDRVAGIIKPFTTPGMGSADAFHFARSKQEEHDLWAARKEALFTMVSIRPPGTEVWSTDVAVPVSRLAEIIDLSKRECGQLGIFASVIGHVGDGNFHVAMMYDPRDADQKQAVGRCVKNMMHRALDMEGTVSGEHAIGIGKKDCLVDELGEETIGLMRTLKKAVDPGWVMNPGKVFDWADERA